MIQGSPEWFAERLGKVTASRIADVVAKTRAGWGASRANYMAQLIAERLTGRVQESYTNAAMQWGTDTEPEARAAYEFRTNAEVVQVGFVSHPKINMAGASPDGLISEDGLIEIKCPSTATHLDTLLGRAPDEKYVLQTMWQMACTGRKWCDFVSYDPRLPESMRLFIARIKRNDDRIKELERDVKDFLAEIDSKIDSLTAIYAKDAA